MLKTIKCTGENANTKPKLFNSKKQGLPTFPNVLIS